MDAKADAIIRKTILSAFPNHDLLTEESVPTAKNSPYKWIVDPLDGTTNFAHNYPQVGVSIGLEYKGKNYSRRQFMILSGTNFSGPKKIRGHGWNMQAAGAVLPFRPLARFRARFS